MKKSFSSRTNDIQLTQNLHISIIVDKNDSIGITSTVRGR